MLKVGTLPDKAQAQRFSDHLWRLNVEHEVDKGRDGDWEVWIADHDRKEEFAELLTRFIADPKADEFKGAGRAAKKIKSEAKREAKRSRRNVVDVRTTWNRAEFLQVKPVTALLMAVSFALALASQFGDNIRILEPLFYGGFTLDSTGHYFNWLEGWNSVKSGEVWRIFTPMFIHFGPIHLLFNMIWLMRLGTAIENKQSSLFLALFVLVCAGLSNTAEFTVNWAHFDSRGSLIGGMSGVVFGLFGHIWICWRFGSKHDYRMEQQTVYLMLIWLVFCFTGLIGPIANVAHTVGLLVGVASGFLWSGELKRRLTRKS